MTSPHMVLAGPVPAAAGVAILLGVGITLALGVLVMLVLRRRRASAAEAGPDRTAAVLAALAARILPELRADAAGRGLLGPAMGVRWRRLGQPGADRPEPAEEREGETRDLPALFRELPAARLVILGEPGAGKTSAGLRIALDLLTGRADEPVPVRIGLSDWDPGRTPLAGHLAGRLRAAGVPGRGVARRLLGQGRVLPVFDDIFACGPAGERGPIAAAQAARCRVEALIGELNREPGLGFVVLADMVRYREATRLGPELDACHVLLEPAPAEDAAAWLRRSVAGVAQLAGDPADSKVARCTDLLDRLGRAPGGDEVLRTPQSLAMLESLVYGGPDAVRRLPSGGTEQIRTYLFRSRLEGACPEGARPEGARLEGARLADTGDLAVTLRFLARRMRETAAPVLRLPAVHLLMPEEARRRRWWGRVAAALAAGTVAGAVLSFLVGAVALLTGEAPGGGWQWGAAFGALVGLAAGAGSELRGRRPRPRRRIRGAGAGLVLAVVLAAVGSLAGAGALILVALAAWWALDDGVRARLARRQLRREAPGLGPALLETAADRGLLRRIGDDGYVFAHDGLRDWLADAAHGVAALPRRRRSYDERDRNPGAPSSFAAVVIHQGLLGSDRRDGHF